MYLGRIVVAGMTRNGKAFVAYRVSSRSFPNREAKIPRETVSVVPRPGFEDDLKKNPYITYNCIRHAASCIVASNGSHTDPIAEKIAMGMPPRDAMALGLLAMDYEKDSYNTPRVVSLVDTAKGFAYLGIIRHDAVLVQGSELKPGTARYISTYEHNSTDTDKYADRSFDAEKPDEICSYVLRRGVFADFEHPVTAAASLLVEGKLLSAVANA